MRAKNIHREQLVTNYETGEINQRVITLTYAVVVIAIACMAEGTNMNGTRLLALGLLWKLLQEYNKTINNLKFPVIKYDAQVALRDAAQKDDVTRLEKCVKVLGKSAISLQGPSSGKTALHFAVGSGAVAAIRYLLDEGADVNSPDSQRNTPVHVAIERICQGKRGGYRTLFTLIEIGTHSASVPFSLGHAVPPVNFKIDPTLKNNKGETIADLLKKIPDQSNADFIKAKGLINFLVELKMRAAEQPELKAGIKK